MEINITRNKKGNITLTLTTFVFILMFIILLYAFKINEAKEFCYDLGMEYQDIKVNEFALEYKIEKVYCKDYKGNQEIRSYEVKNE